jgi:hypothetical protein
MLTIIWTGYQGYSARKAAKYNMQLKKEKVQDLISCLLFVEFMYKAPFGPAYFLLFILA